MYAAFFGLAHEPFSIAPDPRYLFMSERHREALAHLLYGLSGGGGFVLLSGEIGAGKTTVCRCFLEQLPPACRMAYVLNPRLSAIELLQTICEEFGVALDPALAASPKHGVDSLNAFLLAGHGAGRSHVLIIDEAQNLAPEVLEQLRLLTNLETSTAKLLQIILIGQPELRQMLAAPALEQLAQRVIARYHLGALSEAETRQYVQHRLAVAGSADGPLPPLFDTAALRGVYRLSRGVPRRINLLCDRALLGAYAQGRRQVDKTTLRRAAAEVFADEKAGSPSSAPRARWWRWGLAGTALAAGLAAWALLAPALLPAPSPPPALTVAAAPAPAPASAPAEVSPAAAPAMLPPPLSAEPAITLALRNERDAWRELALAWQIELPEGAADDPCPALARQQGQQEAASAAVRCFRSDAGLALLRQLGRPAILTLHDGSGRPGYVLLAGLSERQAWVRAGTAQRQVSLLQLSQQWRGEFATLWRVPPGYGVTPPPGSGLDDWVSARLDPLFGASAGPSELPLAERVAAFQRAQGLKSDGRAGPLTLMQLNRASGVVEPALTVALP